MKINKFFVIGALASCLAFSMPVSVHAEEWNGWENFLNEMNPYSKSASYQYDYTFWGNYAPVEYKETPDTYYPDPEIIKEHTETKGNIVGVCVESASGPVVETKPGIVGNHYIPDKSTFTPLTEEEYRELFPGRYRREQTGGYCKGCREYHKNLKWHR